MAHVMTDTNDPKKHLLLPYRQQLALHSGMLIDARHSLRKVNRAGARDGRGVSTPSSDNCTNQLCLPEAGYLVSRLNLSVGQCDDFYRFVCSDRWFEHDSRELPFRFSSVQHVYDALQRYAKDGLLHLINDEKLNASSALVKTLMFVDNCTSSVIIADVDPLLQLKQRLRRWHEADLLSAETYHWVLKKSASLLPSIQHLTVQQYQDVLKISKELLMMAAYRPPVPEHSFVTASEFAMYEKINLTSFLATLFEQSHVYTKESLIAVNSKAYFHRLFTYLDTGVDESTVLNYLGVYLWVHLSPLFPDEHSSAPHLPGLQYGMPGASKRFPLCLRYAESLCPQGMFALLTVALGQTNSSVEFVRPLEWWIGDFKDLLFSYTKRLTWLDGDTTQEMSTKVERMRISFLIPASLLQEPNVFKWTCEVYQRRTSENFSRHHQFSGSYSLKNYTVISSWTENATLRFNALEDCLLKTYIDRLLAPLNYTTGFNHFASTNHVAAVAGIEPATLWEPAEHHSP
ncbi:hypothetical protein HPB51_024034 [Rhipicephalus microplus]|uniref:Peptidase M13 N-terminal domain-containing protein n=1 Tax=Rhipicephalus microplus TaxID=6941 RepID=A0A9J6ED69_RHIMP|nr:hypothetical protein HPB51_024034 [Rhipicephalus microplus]